jgi:hypothetical protein
MLQDFKDGDLYKATDEFLDYHQVEKKYYYYSEKNDAISPFAELLGNKLGDVINEDAAFKNDRFNYNTIKGNYTWNKTAQKWDKTNSDKIVALFPSKEGQNNNCELAITTYTDQQCNIESDNVWLPTKANAYLKKDGVTLASADMTASFTQYGIPTKVDVSAYAKPLKITATLNQDAASKYSASASMVDETNGANNLSMAATVTLSKNLNKYSDFDDIADDDVINVIALNVTQSDLSIEGTVNLRDALRGGKPNDTQINLAMNLTVKWHGAPKGTLKVQTLGDGNRYLFIFYSDGSNENTEVYYDLFINNLEDMFTKYVNPEVRQTSAKALSVKKRLD